MKPNKQKTDWEKTFDKNWINPWERNNFGIPKAHLDIKDFISKTLQQQREETIEYISLNQGWEETGDKYREHFGLPIKYKKENK